TGRAGAGRRRRCPRTGARTRPAAGTREVVHEAVAWPRFLALRLSARTRGVLEGIKGRFGACPRQESNLHPALRRRVLYPLSYEGGGGATEINRLVRRPRGNVVRRG